MNISSGVSADGLKMVILFCVFADGLVMVLEYSLWECDTGLLEQSAGLGRSLGCMVGIQLVHFGQLFIG